LSRPAAQLAVIVVGAVEPVPQQTAYLIGDPLADAVKHVL